MVPERLVAESGWIDGQVRFEFPRFRYRPGRWFGRLLGVSESLRLTLDATSSAVWELIDGRRTVADIAAELRRCGGDSIEPAEERLGKLLAVMERNRMIRYRSP